jgi:hypothetical protein
MRPICHGPKGGESGIFDGLNRNASFASHLCERIPRPVVQAGVAVADRARCKGELRTVKSVESTRPSRQSFANLRLNTRAAEPLRELVGVEHARETPTHVFPLITPLSPASPIFDAAQAVEVVDRIECAAEAALGSGMADRRGRAEDGLIARLPKTTPDERDCAQLSRVPQLTKYWSGEVHAHPQQRKDSSR